MKKIIILSSIVFGIVINSLAVSAKDDTKYPAYDFKPEVIFIDKEAIEKMVENHDPPHHPMVVLVDEKYPAYNFQPKVIFIDKDAIEGSEESVYQHHHHESITAIAVYDKNYPAYNYQPKVIYIDRAAVNESTKKRYSDPRFPAAYFDPVLVFPDPEEG